MLCVKATDLLNDILLDARLNENNYSEIFFHQELVATDLLNDILLDDRLNENNYSEIFFHQELADITRTHQELADITRTIKSEIDEN